MFDEMYDEIDDEILRNILTKLFTHFSNIIWQFAVPNDFVEPFPEFRRTIRPTIWLAFRRANFVSARSITPSGQNVLLAAATGKELGQPKPKHTPTAWTWGLGETSQVGHKTTHFQFNPTSASYYTSRIWSHTDNRKILELLYPVHNGLAMHLQEEAEYDQY